MSAKHLIFSACAVLFFISAAYMDLALRARSAYLEGEKYMAWAGNPALKKDFFEKTFSPRLKVLEDGVSGGRLSAADLEDKKALLMAEKEFRSGESSAKYAYIWYKTAAADLAQPGTRWALLARQKTPKALELWKAELRAAKTDFKDHSLE